MPRPTRSNFLITLLSLAMLAATVAHAQDTPRPQGKGEEPARTQPPDAPNQTNPDHPPVLEFKDEIKPLPPVAIPDDPPPHEGAFFDIPLTIEPPDIIIVEVIEALPGRPITGERLVRPDGTISLGFYGDLYVRGLTLTQVKVKVLQHLRSFMSDEVLGLVKDGGPPGEVEMPKEEGNLVPINPGRNPFDLGKEPVPAPEVVPPAEKKPEPEAKPAENDLEARPSARPVRNGRTGRSRVRRRIPTSAQVPPNGERRASAPVDPPPDLVPKPDTAIIAVEPAQVEGQMIVIPPASSDRVFVDITSHNTKVYYVQGDVGVPGRLPFTGKETVLDALNYAGGLVPTAEPTDIHLYRPARGGKLAKDYKIDLDAIHRGIASANLQLFPNDRLVVGRNPIVKKTIEIDRANGLINSMAATARNDMIKDWAEFLWSITAQGGGAMLDEKAFKEALMKKLSHLSESK